MEMDSLEFVLAEQRRQIADAKTLDSDLDFAFNLQMQEAINASLALSPNLHPPNDAVPSLNADDDVFEYTALVVEDIERLDQERRDREACERLTREMIRELDRRMHDRNFATKILRIPDDEWERNGDNYHLPYGADRASSSSSQGEGFLKVYCKGLESEEMIKDIKVIVGGIGVAICDSRDHVMFELSKGLEVVGPDGGKGEGESVVVATIEAVLEGLNAALELGLKRVVIYCDDSLAHQYVTRTVQPKQGKISTLVNKLSLLSKKFTDCKASLVAHKDNKFAYKLARDAIVSQITWPEEPCEGKIGMKETCVICYEDIDVEQIFSVDGCLHRFCFSCMKRHVEVKILNGMEAKCPQEGCESEVSIDACVKFMDPKLVKIMSQRKKEVAIAVTEKIYCPFLRCSALMSKTEVLEYTKTSFVGAENSGARKCIKCQYFFCVNCKVPWHYNMTCDDYRRANPYPRTEDALLNNLAKQKRWRPCVKCSHMVELAEGCYHITCRCGYEFCYTCGAEWKNKKPTCRCPIWDERNIIHDRRRR